MTSKGKELALGEYRAEGDHRTIRFERIYDASEDDRWSALTDPSRLRGWLAPAGAELDGRPGGAYEFRMSEDEAHRTWGDVRVWEPPRVLELGWNFAGQDGSIVRFELDPRGDETMLVLEHRSLPVEQSVGYGSGWHAYLDALDDHLTGRSGSWEERFEQRLEAYRERATGS
jgi:uncharacterized protein YndB with AHSA1/START domain